MFFAEHKRITYIERDNSEISVKTIFAYVKIFNNAIILKNNHSISFLRRFRRSKNGGEPKADSFIFLSWMNYNSHMHIFLRQAQ